MTDVNPDGWSAAASEALMEPAQRKPHEADYGFCVYGDAPAAIGGGTPWFYWFENEATMLRMLSDHAVFLHPAQHIDATATRALVKDAVIASRGDLEALRGQLNQLLKSVSQFTWIGSFKDLRESEHPAAKQVRGEFRSPQGESSGMRTIEDEDVADFAEFVGSYGI
jgi:hypothetical protein